MKRPSLLMIFQILTWVIVLDLINGIFFIIFPLGISHPLQYNGLAQEIISSGSLSLLLAVTIIVLCRLRWRVAFVCAFIIYLHFLCSKLPIIGYPIPAMFSSIASIQFRAEILIAILAVLISLVGILLAVYNQLKSASSG